MSVGSSFSIVYPGFTYIHMASLRDSHYIFGLPTFRMIQEGIKLAIASRSPVDEGGAARGILGALGLLDMFCYLEIHRGSKAGHFQVMTCFPSGLQNV